MKEWVNFKKLSDDAQAPTHGSEYAAGYDLYISRDVTIEPGSFEMAHTDIAMEIPQGHFGGIFPRSGMATKQGIRLRNCVGVIDADYRGEIMIAAYNDSKETQSLTKGTRIAQLILIPYTEAIFKEVDELDETDRGAGGFGSTGTK